MTAGVDGSVEPEDAALDSRRDRRPGVLGDGVPVPSLVDQGVRGEDNVLPEADAGNWRDTGRRLHMLGHFSENRRRTDGGVGDGTATLTAIENKLYPTAIYRYIHIHALNKSDSDILN